MRSQLLMATFGSVLAMAGAALSFSDQEDRDTPTTSPAERIIEAVDSTVSAPSDSPPLIVHEWGTFTSFSGSDGIKLEFRPLADNDLPPFVLNRLDQAGFSFRKRSIPALQRMETPVTYFYTPVERDVSVRVDFQNGLLTEFYPPVRDYAPLIDASNLENWPELAAQSHVRTAVPLKDSMLDWGTVHLIPPHALRACVEDEELARRIGRHVERSILPDASGFAHYTAARNTDSAIVQFRQEFTDENGQVTSVLDDFEKFLFYRGVGNFELPLSLEALDREEFTLTNDGRDEVRSLFLVTVHGEELRFRQADGIPAQSRMTLRQSETVSSMDELAAQVAAALEAEGLYEKEAWAMIDTWRQSWFGEEGTRLFYFLPQRVTDELLPLRVEPVPDEMIRVLVGRMEIMSPSDEQQVLGLVNESVAARGQHVVSGRDEAFVSPVLERILMMGRLAEPALVRAHVVADAREIRDEAAQLLVDLRTLQAAESVAAAP